MSNVENLNSAENKMLRTLQAHGKTQPGVPYHADGEELDVIRDLRKKGLVMYTEPSHPHERYGYALSGAGIVAVDALTAIQHPPAQAGEFQREDRYIVIKRKDLEKAPTMLTHALRVALYGLREHLPERECLVVESDWPEYKPAWSAIQARVTGRGEQAVDDARKAAFENHWYAQKATAFSSTEAQRHFDAGWKARAALAAPPAEKTPFERGVELAKRGGSVSDVWGACKDDSEMGEVHRGLEYGRNQATDPATGDEQAALDDLRQDEDVARLLTRPVAKVKP